MFFEVDVAKRLGGASIALRFASDAPVTALIGPSGAGKTTILHMISGILRPDRGRIEVGGRLLFDSAGGVDLAPERRGCGHVFQDLRLFPHMNVLANLRYGRREGPAPIAESEAIALLGLEPLLERRPGSLSGGEARRVATARALLSAPDFLLLDEPLASLDAQRREELLAAIERVRDRARIPILLVSHQAEEVARLAGQVVHITPG